MYNLCGEYETAVHEICTHACKILKYPHIEIKSMNRTRSIGKNKSYVLGYTNLKRNIVTLDIYTARLRKPKKISAILHVLAHELAHHQKPPYREWYKGRWIVRQHFPRFYKQVCKNIKKFKKDKTLKQYFV